MGMQGGRVRLAVLPEVIDGRMVKRCCRCKQAVATDLFSPNRHLKSGLSAICKPCRRKPPEQDRRRCRFIDRTGERYGRLQIVGYVGQDDTTSRSRIWRCQCDCGSVVLVNWKQIRANHTRSCGCLNRERIAKAGGQNVLPPGESAFNQLFYLYQKSARERGYQFSLSKDEFRTLTSSDCHYCSAPPAVKYRAAKGTNGHYFGNGVDREDNTRGYESDNVRPCCKQCNIAKGVLTVAEFRAWALRLARCIGESGSPR